MKSLLALPSASSSLPFLLLLLLFLLLPPSSQAFVDPQKVHAKQHASDRTGTSLSIWDHPSFSPWALRSLTNFYLECKRGTTYFDENQVEIIFAATSAAIKCEVCASFHWPHLLDYGLDEDDARLVVRGGLPRGSSDAAQRAARLVEATQYMRSRGGILLPDEKRHLRALMFDEGQLAEILAVSGAMAMIGQFHTFLQANPAQKEDATAAELAAAAAAAAAASGGGRRGRGGGGSGSGGGAAAAPTLDVVDPWMKESGSPYAATLYHSSMARRRVEL